MGSALVHSDNADVREARTHVLILGLGHYPMLKGGGPASDNTAMLGQLTSPGPSARAIANWFIAEYHYPVAPLGTVAILLSEEPRAPYSPPGGGARLVPVPTYSDVAVEVEAWCKRGDGNEDSRLIFLFCGHGFGYGPVTSLLMSGFDFRSGNPWSHAIDLEKLRAGAEKYAASEQLFFIDACRRPHGDLIPPGRPSAKHRSAPSRSRGKLSLAGARHPSSSRPAMASRRAPRRATSAFSPRDFWLP